ncbi:Phosphoribulokinase/uridine kinase [Penicillium paradoxum]|uniref:Phosphoribulokinase/uridine kinase n=1 Tax=Penicillium paradoxum TaxID=176176 RepID=UPI002549A80A|nr:Phosphoribulokinase/uridine kinase [Penicillium paradoxum]KAJ5779228.1 Phosphoribulokinase/uridine kinase [Penicillium paradoxum]
MSTEVRYAPPWQDLSIIGVAGSSGSGKTSVAMEIVKSLNLPWVVILVMDSFYKTLTSEQHHKAHANEYDFDCPGSIDFDLLVETLRDLKKGKKANIPVYSFADHQRQSHTTTLYSPRVIILEGILALHDPRIVEMLDVKIFVEADMDVCLGRRILRDVRERGRDIDGIIKQWFDFVKPSYTKFVEPQRPISDIIIPRGIENRTAIDMVVKHIQRKLQEKSDKHSEELHKLGLIAAKVDLPPNVHVLPSTPQFVGMNTILQNPKTGQEDFVFYFDRLASILIEKSLDMTSYISTTVETPQANTYLGLHPKGIVSAVAILRGGSCMETALKRSIPDCITGRVLIQTNKSNEEPELHYLKLPSHIEEHATVILMDSQISSGGAALMAVRVLIDHGVEQSSIVFVTCAAGERGLKRLTAVYPKINVIVGRIEEEGEPRWIEKRYFGC